MPKSYIANRPHWKEGSCFTADAEKVFTELEKLRGTSALEDLSPRSILEFAKNPKTEIHKCFDWDDTRAAEKHRLAVAGTILRALVYDRYVVQRVKEIPKDHGEVIVAKGLNEPRVITVPTRVYERQGPRSFAPTEIVLSDDEKSAMLLRTIRQAISILRGKIQNYEDIRKTNTGIDEHLERAEALTDSLLREHSKKPSSKPQKRKKTETA